MKWLLPILLIICAPSASSQEIPAGSEQQLENQAGLDQGETEDDSWIQELELFRKHPIDINRADAEELKQLRILNGLQIASLINYRRLLGRLVSLYELQAIPGWDIPTIKKIRSFIALGPVNTIRDDWRNRFRKGEHSLLLRIAQVPERSKGYDKDAAGNGYLGSPQRVTFRYRYVYKTLLQFGVLGDKDAGERFFKGAQQTGFDFYSFHLFARKTGIIQSLALGDFTVNMGQGLIQWQGLAFKKSADVIAIKRQSALLRPYTSAGEFYFHRGAGITVRKGRMEATFFTSLRKLSANGVRDTVSAERFVTSFQSSGYHRTANEGADRNGVSQTAFGGNLTFHTGRLQAEINGIYYRFSLPIRKGDEPYNRYAVSGSSWHNFSAGYHYTWKNLHVFGELAADRNFNRAFLNGLLISVDTRVDLSLLHRDIAPAYRAFYGNAFTENSEPANEKGIYAGISLRPGGGWRIDAYADLFRFNWLKYRTDAPSRGTDLLVQLSYNPNKETELYTRYRVETKQGNQPDNRAVTGQLVLLPRQNWRTQVNYKVNSDLTLRLRTELLWYDRNGSFRESGSLFYVDILYKPMLKPYAAGVRMQYFETDGYNSRIYAYENDVLFSYSIPAFFERGYRYYLNLEYHPGKKFGFWLRWARLVHPGKSSLGSGLDETPGSGRSELKFQARVLL